MADLLTVDQITELRKTFAMFDRGGGGNITLQELTEALKSLGQNVSREDVRQMVDEADLDANGVVDFPEFLALVANRLNDAEEAEGDLIEAFKFYDLNNTGYISATNLMYAMAKLGCRLTPEEADEMIREADLDMDGKLNYRDFRRVMMQPPDFGVSRTAGLADASSAAAAAASGHHNHPQHKNASSTSPLQSIGFMTTTNSSSTPNANTASAAAAGGGGGVGGGGNQQQSSSQQQQQQGTATGVLRYAA